MHVAVLIQPLSCTPLVISMFNLFSTGSYGARGMATFIKMAKSYNVCIPFDEGVPGTATIKDFKAIIEQLMAIAKAQVIVCFCEGRTVKTLLQATIEVPGAQSYFLILGRQVYFIRNSIYVMFV